MSWQQLLNDKSLTITTGDGTEYKPNWLNATKDTQYNTKVYDFPNLEGSYVLRKKKRGDRFKLELYFTGEDATDLAASFELSARDPRPWSLVHPFYDTRLIQPLGLTIDDSVYNTSKVTVQAVETISFQQLAFKAIPTDEIIALKASFDTSIESSFLEGVPVPSQDDIVEIKKNIGIFDKLFEPIILKSDTLSDFKVLVGKATSGASTLINNASAAIRTINNLINYPATIAQTLESRISAFKEVLNTFSDTISLNNDSDSASQSDKNIFLAQGASIVSNIAYASIIQPSLDEDETYSLEDDYYTRKDILNQIDSVLDAYNTFLVLLDSLTTDRADGLKSFFANHDLMFLLDQLITKTVSNLESTIFDAVQERTLVLEKDSDIINVSYRLYGADDLDANIDRIIDTNDLSLNNMLVLKKGTSILYYA